jgi:hypothetical protein
MDRVGIDRIDGGLMRTSIKCEMVTYTWTMTMVAGPCLRPADTGTEVVLANMEYCGRAENNFGSRHFVCVVTGSDSGRRLATAGRLAAWMCPRRTYSNVWWVVVVVVLIAAMDQFGRQCRAGWVRRSSM